MKEYFTLLQGSNPFQSHFEHFKVLFTGIKTNKCEIHIDKII